jgi:hypothetical protein
MQLPLIFLVFFAICQYHFVICSHHIHIGDVLVRTGGVPQKNIFTDLKEKLHTKTPCELTVARQSGPIGMIKRTPYAFKLGLARAVNAFTDSAIVTIPFGLVYHINQIGTPIVWLQSSLATSWRWGKVSAAYAVSAASLRSCCSCCNIFFLLKSRAEKDSFKESVGRKIGKWLIRIILFLLLIVSMFISVTILILDLDWHPRF